jgi:DNA-binding MarR family transcriptional regulator
VTKYFDTKTIASTSDNGHLIVDQLIALVPSMLRMMGRFLENDSLPTPVLPPPQMRILQELADYKNPINMGDLASFLDITAGSLTPTIKKLVSLGLVERKRSTKDDRVVELTLSQKGQHCVEDEIKRLKIAFDEITKNLTSAQQNDFLNAHQQIVEILELASQKKEASKCGS